MNEYKIVSNKNGFTTVLKYDGELYIPSDPKNMDWIAYMVYVDNGGLTDPTEVTNE